MQSINFLERLLQITKELAEIRTVDAALRYVVGVAADFVQAQRGYLVLFSDETDPALDYRVSYDVQQQTNDSAPTTNVSTTILRRVQQTGEAQLITDALDHPDFRYADSVRDNRLRSVLCVPLLTQERRIGALYMENRRDANLFNKADLRTLSLLATQCAALLQNAILHEDLRRSREALVLAREAERRRLRRDLHDGIGPLLATIGLEIQTASNLLPTDAEQSRTMLARTHDKTQTALHDLRRIVYDLRPPVLDELGLIYALREVVSSFQDAHPLQITFQASHDAPELSAAAEVATYYIVCEALNNAIKHADARHCTIRLTFAEAIQIDVQDNGVGIAVDASQGVGLRSMQERVAELRGSFRITQPCNGGTHLRVSLPYHQEINHHD
jgi:signal transduction histidine kinase